MASEHPLLHATGAVAHRTYFNPLPPPTSHDSCSWQGCIVIFLSNFLALLIRVEAAEEERQETLGGLLIGVNLVLVIAVLVTTWFSTQQMVEGAREGEDSVGVSVAKTMLTAERLAANDCGTKREGK